MKIVDIPAQLAAVAQGSFIDTVDFNSNSFGACDITGLGDIMKVLNSIETRP
jgi:hypothetical protein